jgi:hypothetical protein
MRDATPSKIIVISEIERDVATRQSEGEEELQLQGPNLLRANQTQGKI